MSKETSLLSVPRGETPEMTRFLQRLKQAVEYIADNGGGDGQGATLSKGAFIQMYKQVAQGGFIPPPYESLPFIEGLLDALNGRITESQLYKDLGARINKIEVNETAISIETQERIAALLAATEAINGNKAAIAQESETRSTEFEAVGSRLDLIVTQTNENTASIVTERLARTTEDSAHASRLDALDVVTTQAGARIGTLETAVVNNEQAIASAKTELRSEFDSTINGVGPDSITNRIDKNTAAINLESVTRANEISSYAAQQAVIQTTVNGHTASIEEIRQSVDGSVASWQIRADVDGVVGGIGFTNNGATVDFIVRASTFAIAGPSGSKSTPFTVVTEPITVNGQPVPAGTYMTDTFIQNGSITNAKIGNASVDTLQIKGDAVIVSRAQYTAVPTSIALADIGVDTFINEITIDAMGGGIAVQFGFEDLKASARSNEDPQGSLGINVYRGETLLRTMVFRSTKYISDWLYVEPPNNNKPYYTPVYKHEFHYRYNAIPTFLDTPPAGAHIYRVAISKIGGNLSDISITARSLFLLGAKR